MKNLKKFNEYINEYNSSDYYDPPEDDIEREQADEDVRDAIDIILTALYETPEFILFKKRLQDDNVENDTEIQKIIKLAKNRQNDKLFWDILDKLFFDAFENVLKKYKKAIYKNNAYDWCYDNWFIDWIIDSISIGEFQEDFNNEIWDKEMEEYWNYLQD